MEKSTFLSRCFHFLSDRRGSNPRPAAWEAAALPTELLSRSEVSVCVDYRKNTLLTLMILLYCVFLFFFSRSSSASRDSSSSRVSSSSSLVFEAAVSQKLAKYACGRDVFGLYGLYKFQHAQQSCRFGIFLRALRNHFEQGLCEGTQNAEFV